MNVLFLEPNISKASPLLTIERILIKLGASCRYQDPKTAPTSVLIKEYRRADVVIIQFYRGIDTYVQRQLAFATLLGVPVIRNWAGTDALNAITMEPVRATTIRTDCIVSANMTTTHQGIVDELDSIGLACDLLPQVIDKVIPRPSNPDVNLPLAAMAYLPSERFAFYGGERIETLVKHFPEVTFYILADTEHQLAHYPNVESLGWVDDMEPVWEKTGVVVRMTEHDGYPRMLIEALGRGRYVIHNNPLPGVKLAHSNEEMIEAMTSFVDAPALNKTGVEIYHDAISDNPEVQIASFIRQVKVKPITWLRALRHIIKGY